MAPVSRRSWNWPRMARLDSAMGVGGSKGRDMGGRRSWGALYRDGRFSGPFQPQRRPDRSRRLRSGQLPTGELVAGGRDRLLKYNGKNLER